MAFPADLVRQANPELLVTPVLPVIPDPLGHHPTWRPSCSSSLPPREVPRKVPDPIRSRSFRLRLARSVRAVLLVLPVLPDPRVSRVFAVSPAKLVPSVRPALPDLAVSPACPAKM